MLGFYSYTVILTYMGLASAMTAIYMSMLGHYKLAIFFMLFAGLCDMFDGKVARTKKNRTESEKKFGIQIDSLCDVVCFSATPALVLINIAHNIGSKFEIPAVIAGILFTLCGVIRLAFFNVEEEERQNKTSERRKYYRGFPVTGSAGIVPAVYAIWSVICKLASLEKISDIFVIIYTITLLITGFFNIFDIKVSKPGKIGFIVIPIIGVITLAVIIAL